MAAGGGAHRLEERAHIPGFEREARPIRTRRHPPGKNRRKRSHHRIMTPDHRERARQRQRGAIQTRGARRDQNQVRLVEDPQALRVGTQQGGPVGRRLFTPSVGPFEDQAAVGLNHPPVGMRRNADLAFDDAERPAARNFGPVARRSPIRRRAQMEQRERPLLVLQLQQPPTSPLGREAAPDGGPDVEGVGCLKHASVINHSHHDPSVAGDPAPEGVVVQRVPARAQRLRGGDDLFAVRISDRLQAQHRPRFGQVVLLAVRGTIPGHDAEAGVVMHLGYFDIQLHPPDRGLEGRAQMPRTRLAGGEGQVGQNQRRIDLARRQGEVKHRLVRRIQHLDGHLVCFGGARIQLRRSAVDIEPEAHSRAFAGDQQRVEPPVGNRATGRGRVVRAVAARRERQQTQLQRLAHGPHLPTLPLRAVGATTPHRRGLTRAWPPRCSALLPPPPGSRTPTRG